MKRYNSLFKFTEEVAFADLYKSSMSVLTQHFAKETNQLMGAPTKHSKFIQAKFNTDKDYIIFIFLTERTPKYKDNFHTGIVDPDTWEIMPDNLYTIEIKVLGVISKLKQMTNNFQDELTNKMIEDVITQSYIQIWSDVPSFHWQGGNYYLSRLGGSIHPTDIPPKHWDKYHHKKQLLDKHSAGIINSYKFYIPQMRQTIKKYLGKTKQKTK